VDSIRKGEEKNRQINYGATWKTWGEDGAQLRDKLNGATGVKGKAELMGGRWGGTRTGLRREKVD